MLPAVSEIRNVSGCAGPAKPAAGVKVATPTDESTTVPAGEVADPDVLLTAADEAMYRTKAARRGGRDIRIESA